MESAERPHVALTELVVTYTKLGAAALAKRRELPVLSSGVGFHNVDFLLTHQLSCFLGQGIVGIPFDVVGGEKHRLSYNLKIPIKYGLCRVAVRPLWHGVR